MGPTFIKAARFLPVFMLAMAGSGLADQVLVVQKSAAAPTIDGVADGLWAQASETVTWDTVAGIPIQLKAVHSGDSLFFLVRFPDPDESRGHRSWTWDSTLKEYTSGDDREDGFVFKWLMEGPGSDLTLTADDPYTADIWFWKACRTDPVGYADDKIQRLGPDPTQNSRAVTSKSGRTLHLQRSGDNGEPAYKTRIVVEYQGLVIPRFEVMDPQGSRADIRAKGGWSDGYWTIEFGRRLITGHPDDVQFQTGGQFLFGVSRYEIAGRAEESGVNQPLFGCGDISEHLTLQFAD